MLAWLEDRQDIAPHADVMTMLFENDPAALADARQWVINNIFEKEKESA